MSNTSSKQVAEAVEVKGRRLECPVCGNHLFHTRKALINTRVRTFFNFDWTDRGATCHVCSECNYVFWFLNR